MSDPGFDIDDWFPEAPPFEAPCPKWLPIKIVAGLIGHAVVLAPRRFGQLPPMWALGWSGWWVERKRWRDAA